MHKLKPDPLLRPHSCQQAAPQSTDRLVDHLERPAHLQCSFNAVYGVHVENYMACWLVGCGHAHSKLKSPDGRAVERISPDCSGAAATKELAQPTCTPYSCNC